MTEIFYFVTKHGRDSSVDYFNFFSEQQNINGNDIDFFKEALPITG